MSSYSKMERLARRQRRIRKRISGSGERPRLSVSRSLKHIYAQIVDDTTGKTLVFAGTTGKAAPTGTKTERAKEIGTKLAGLAKEKGITKVVFDRGGRPYHGRIKALAEGAREGGLEF